MEEKLPVERTDLDEIDEQADQEDVNEEDLEIENE